jgi:hypothetical protein
MFSFSMQLPSNQKRNQITTVTLATKPFIVPCKLAMLETETHNHKNQPKKTRKQKKMEKKRRKRGEGNKLKGETRSQRKGTKFY